MSRRLHLPLLAEFSSGRSRVRLAVHPVPLAGVRACNVSHIQRHLCGGAGGCFYVPINWGGWGEGALVVVLPLVVVDGACSGRDTDALDSTEVKTDSSQWCRDVCCALQLQLLACVWSSGAAPHLLGASVMSSPEVRRNF